MDDYDECDEEMDLIEKIVGRGGRHMCGYVVYYYKHCQVEVYITRNVVVRVRYAVHSLIDGLCERFDGFRASPHGWYCSGNLADPDMVGKVRDIFKYVDGFFENYPPK